MRRLVTVPTNSRRILSNGDSITWEISCCCIFTSLLLLVGWDWVHLVLRPLFGLLYQPQMIDDDCGAIGGMKIGRGNRSTRRKFAPAPLCPPQIPHDQTWARTRAAAVGSQRLNAWAMARPCIFVLCNYFAELTSQWWKAGKQNGRTW
jgi:hypothetical protein